MLSKVLIRGGYLLDTQRPFSTADVLIDNGKISSIGTNLPVGDARLIEARDKIVMPGFVNAHTHSHQAIEKGLCDSLPLDAWMILAGYGGANAELRPRDLYVSAMVGAIEMIRTGSTSVLDMARVDYRWFNEGIDAIMSAYAQIGMRAAVAAMYTDLDFVSSLPLDMVPDAADVLKPRRTNSVEEVLGLMGGYLQRWTNRDDRLLPMLGPQSLPRCSTELFEASVDLASRRGSRLQTHLLSGKSQVFVGQQRYGGSTVKFLDRIGCLKPWASFAHSIWLDDNEIKLIGGSPAVVVHNPVSNMKLGAGRSPIPALRRAGARIALGSDGASSQDSQNMFETMKGAANLHRIAHEEEDWVTAPAALEMCWDGGGAALGQKLGRLEPGYEADLVLLHTRNLFLAPKEQMAGQIVQSELGASVDTVLVAGQVVLESGKFLNIDEEGLHREAQEIASRLYAGLPDRLTRFKKIQPTLRQLERTVNATALPFTRFCT